MGAVARRNQTQVGSRVQILDLAGLQSIITSSEHQVSFRVQPLSLEKVWDYS